jgi:hypothetical protein
MTLFRLLAILGQFALIAMVGLVTLAGLVILAGMAYPPLVAVLVR